MWAVWCVALVCACTAVAAPVADVISATVPAVESSTSVLQPAQANEHNTIQLKEIWYINLDTQTNRREHMEQQLHALQTPHFRKSACHVAKISDALQDPAMRSVLEKVPGFIIGGVDTQHPDKELPRKSKFVVSVFLSHLTLYHHLMERFPSASAKPGDAVLVLEDDVNVSQTLEEQLSQLQDKVPNDWEMLRLDHWGFNRTSDKVNDMVFKASPPFWDNAVNQGYYGGAHAVLVRLDTLPQLAEKLEASKVTDVDGMMTSYPRLKSYVVRQGLGMVSVEDMPDSSNPSQVNTELRRAWIQDHNLSGEEAARVNVEELIHSPEFPGFVFRTYGLTASEVLRENPPITANELVARAFKSIV